MISFFVPGTPIAQGSKIAWCPTARNADIEEAAAMLDAYANTPQQHTPRHQIDNLIARLAAVDRWPIYIPAKDPTKNGRWMTSLRESSDKKLKPWRKAIAKAAREAYDGETYTGPLRVECVFWFRRPKCHFRTGKFSKILRDDAPKRHTSKPDADKLLRAVLDALTDSGMIRDDAQVDDPHPTKRWLDSREGGEEGVWIHVIFPEDE